MKSCVRLRWRQIEGDGCRGRPHTERCDEKWIPARCTTHPGVGLRWVRRRNVDPHGPRDSRRGLSAVRPCHRMGRLRTVGRSDRRMHGEFRGRRAALAGRAAPSLLLPHRLRTATRETSPGSRGFRKGKRAQVRCVRPRIAQRRPSHTDPAVETEALHTCGLLRRDGRGHLHREERRPRGNAAIRLRRLRCPAERREGLQQVRDRHRRATGIVRNGCLDTAAR